MSTGCDYPVKRNPRPCTAALHFINRQQRDWKVTVLRTSLDKLAYQMTVPYLSIFIVALGANATQLGMVNSIGMICAGLVSLLVGWLIDRNGPKKVYLLGIGMLAASYFIYGAATGWRITIAAMIAYWLGQSVGTQSCATVCGNCLANQDRATGMMLCETVAAGLLGIIGPIVAVWLVTAFGGVSLEGIRPLFFVAFLISGCTFWLVYTQLSNQKWNHLNRSPKNFFKDLFIIVKEGCYLKRWLVVSAIGNVPLGMIFPFSQVFANEIKGAGGVILGAMVAGTSLSSIVLAVPLGRLADRIGRKRVLYLIIPFFWASNVILILSTHSVWLVAAGILQGFYWLGGPISGAMERELVPAERMGRWLGIVRFFRMLFNAAMAFLAGMIWDKVGPQYIFVTFVVLDLLVRVPLLISMPETLQIRFQTQSARL